MIGRLRVAPIVEGDGEWNCVRILLGRIWRERFGGDYVEVLQPIRQPRDSLVREDGDALRRSVGLAIGKLNNPPKPPDVSLVLILIDSEGACPANLAPRLLEMARSVDRRVDVACVLAHPMYETWFVAAAGSLSTYLEVDPARTPTDPEADGLGKSWIKGRIKAPKYRETSHQPAMTQAMDLDACHEKSASFRKLCRELGRFAIPTV